MTILNAANAAAIAAAAAVVDADDDDASGYVSKTELSSPFSGITYCEFSPNITAHQKWTLGRLTGGGVAVKQGNTCLVAAKGGGPVSMAPCDSTSAAQAWHSESVNTTIAQVNPADDATLCLTVSDVGADGDDSPKSTTLETVACVPKPHNCTSLWDHHSAETGVDCTDSPRAGQLWYLSSLGQLSSTYSNTTRGQPANLPHVEFYDDEEPFCLATVPSAKPQAPPLPPAVNHSLPRQV